MKHLRLREEGDKGIFDGIEAKQKLEIETRAINITDDNHSSAAVNQLKQKFNCITLFLPLVPSFQPFSRFCHVYTCILNKNGKHEISGPGFGEKGTSKHGQAEV